MAWLSINTSGWPLEVTRVAATTHCAVTQGTGEPLTLNGQPAMVYGALITTVGCPLTSTRGLGAVGMAEPPCAHSTVAPRCKSGPGMVSFSLSVKPGRYTNPVYTA